MRVLLLGGTGAMGVHLARLLSSSGVETIITTRKHRSSMDNITIIQGDAHDINFVERILKEATIDVCVDFMSYKTDEFTFNSSTLLPNVGRYVFLSSSRVYSDTDSIITENSPRLLDICQDSDYLKTDEYALTKARQENILFYGKYHNWTIVRPYITYSENRLQLGEFEKEVWLRRCLNNQTVVVSNKILDKKATLTYGRDVALLLSAICQKDNTKEEIYNLTIAESMTWRDILGIYSSVIEKQKGIKINLKYHEESPLLTDRAAQYQVKYDRYFNRMFDNSKLSSLIDLNTMCSMQSGLSECMEAFLNNPTFDRYDAKKEAICDKITRDLQSPNQFSSAKQALVYYVQRFIL